MHKFISLKTENAIKEKENYIEIKKLNTARLQEYIHNFIVICKQSQKSQRLYIEKEENI